MSRTGRFVIAGEGVGELEEGREESQGEGGEGGGEWQRLMSCGASQQANGNSSLRSQR